MLNPRILQQTTLNLPQIGLYPFHAGPFRHLKFHIQLLITQIGEKALRNITEQIHTHAQQHQRHCQCQLFMPKHIAQEMTEHTIHPAVIQFSGRTLFHFQDAVRMQRYLRQGKYPAQQQRHRQNNKQIPHIFARGIRRQENRQKSQNRY